MKTVIYLDVLLLTNFLIAYGLLSAAGLLAGLRGRFGRMAAASAAAALTALAILWPEQPYWMQLLYKLGTGAAGGGHRLWRAAAAPLPGCGVLVYGAQPAAGGAVHSGDPAHRVAAAANRQPGCLPAPVAAAARGAGRGVQPGGVAGAVRPVRCARAPGKDRRAGGDAVLYAGAPARGAGYRLPPEGPDHLPASAAHQLPGGAQQPPAARTVYISGYLVRRRPRRTRRPAFPCG